MHDTHTQKEGNRFILSDSWGGVVNLKFMGLGSVSEIWLKVNESKSVGQAGRLETRVEFFAVVLWQTYLLFRETIFLFLGPLTDWVHIVEGNLLYLRSVDCEY